MEEFIENTQKKLGRDVTEEFIKSCKDFDFDYHSFLRGIRTEPLLEIRLDLTSYDRNNFVDLARKTKAFLEDTKPEGQQRNASIKCTKEQKAWEYNVFSSGVDWVESK